MNGVQVSFIGNVTRDPDELRYAANTGNPYLRIGVAVNDYRGPDEKADTYFMDVILFGRMAESAMTRCRKGNPVFVQGRWRMRHFQRQDGSPGYAHEVSAREFHVFDRTGRGQSNDPEPPETPETDQTVMEVVEEGDPFGMEEESGN